MIKLINAVTGGVMWVHEDRLEEYLNRGQLVAPPPPLPAPKKPRTAPKK